MAIFKVLDINGNIIIVDKVENVHKKLNWLSFTSDEICDLNARNLNVSEKKVSIQPEGEKDVNIEDLRNKYVEKFWKQIPNAFKNNIIWIKWKL